MNSARYLRPRSTDEAIDVLSDGEWQVFAGATDIFPASVGRSLTSSVLDLTGIDELRGVQREGGWWRIGACTTWTDIATATLPAQFNGLQRAALQVGGVQIQNRGTVGGNICTASPAGDSIPALLTLSAEAEIVGVGGTRRIRLEDFIVGYRRTALGADEIVAAIHVPDRPGPSEFVKLGARSHLVISIAMISAHIETSDLGPIPRVAVGACSPVAKRLRSLESAFGADVDLDAIDSYSFAELAPIDDVRGSANYRQDVVRPLVARALATCKEQL